jgi:hypothetical protein
MTYLLSTIRNHRRIALGISVTAWVLCIGFGSYVMLAYSARSAAMSASPTSIPFNTKLVTTRDCPSLIVFLHPHCPCSKSTIEHLRKLLTTTETPVECHVLFVVPTGAPRDWEKGFLLDEVKTIQGVDYFIDIDGCEATRFLAVASGEVLLYDKSNQLAFHGCITPSRGQVGDNIGSKAVVNLLRSNFTPYRKSPVFGCPLLNPIQNNRDQAR